MSSDREERYACVIVFTRRDTRDLELQISLLKVLVWGMSVKQRHISTS